jgi:hypothetical protein
VCGQVNDVVYLEAFARQPRSLILPPNEPFIVKVRPETRAIPQLLHAWPLVTDPRAALQEIAGNYLLVSFLLPSARETERLADDTSMGRLKLHRNTIFVSVCA